MIPTRRDSEEQHPLVAAHLPERLDGWRVLEVGGAGGAERVLRDRGAEEVVNSPAVREALLDTNHAFELVYLAGGLDGELHLLAVGAWLWRLTRPGSILVLQGTVLDDPGRSQYAEFATGIDADERWRWTPGRLALRWMVENSGFDFDAWISATSNLEPGLQRVALQAHRVDRVPALDLTRQPLGR